MKKILLLLLVGILSAGYVFADNSILGTVTKWDLVTVPSADVTRMTADDNWIVDSK